MRSPNEQTEKNDRLQLGLLSEMWRTPATTQRNLASRLRVSVGLVNLLVNSMVYKGYVRATQANWRRRIYTITPKGMSRRLSLTRAFISRFLDQYHRIRQLLREELDTLGLHEESRIAVYGTSEFCELVYLALREFDIEQVEFFGPDNMSKKWFLAMRVVEPSSFRPGDYDRVIVSEEETLDISSAQFRELGVTPEQLVTLFGDMSGNQLRMAEEIDRQ